MSAALPTREPALVPNGQELVLDVEDLHVDFGRGDRRVRAVQGFDLQVRAGEMAGLVGESGSGKSVSMLAVLGLLDVESSDAQVSGRIALRGRDLSSMSRAQRRRYCGEHVGVIFQDPSAALNPSHTIGRQIVEPLRMGRRLSREQARRRAIELLELVGIPDASRRLDQYPHEFSGGMRQRAMIAGALSREPALLVADEPTTALDVTIQAQIIDLLQQLQQELGMAVVLITHDLGVVARAAETATVMYAGKVVEAGSTRSILTRAAHPYSVGLLEAVPRLDRPATAELRGIPGSPPDPTLPMVGCPFAPRCSWQVERCVEEEPPLEAVDADHGSACWRWREVVSR